MRDLLASNDWMDFALAGAIALGVMLVIYLVGGLLLRRLARFAEHTATHWDDALVAVLRGTRFPFVLIVGLMVGVQYLELSPTARTVFGRVAVTVLILQAALWANAALRQWLHGYDERQRAQPGGGVSSALIGFLGRVLLWSMFLLLILDNLGVNITALVAGLGVGGIAIALAVQNILGDLFASLSISIDKPFVIGDFIAVDDYLGSVQQIGIKTTRLASLSGEQIVVGNADLLKSRIRNYKRMLERRVVFKLGVVFDTEPAKVERAAHLLRDIVGGRQNVRLDRAHFSAIGESALEFEIVYYVLSPDFNAYMDIQQAINLAILESFRAEGIAFAFPTRTVQVQGWPPAPASRTAGTPAASAFNPA
ncbi:mechanosensitive ion channel family protein [Derxia gummosa]|uniref:Mechanosensitive ion channel family protein n=1 Tax=Derxia gummosa DSM 723 TaxID=1121388 RepID=A0A8B6X637_9BURK|nr:mechanosensitive ion channel family protein [Derxia gummosa]